MELNLDVDQFAALADIARLEILHILSENDYNVSEITAKTNLSRPTISYHLQILKRAGFIMSQKVGKETYYSIKRNTLVNLATEILKFSSRGR